MVALLLSKTPSSIGYFYSRHLAQLIREELLSSSYDLIFVHCSSVAHYVQNTSAVAKILDFGDMDSQKWLVYGKYKPVPLSMGYYLEGLKLQRLEIALAKKFDYCTCTTREELDTLNSFKTGVRTAWFPNGVDTDKFKPTEKPYDPDTICFIGRMDYFPNQECMFDFCANTLPLLQAKRPNLKLMIVGANPSRKVIKLGELPGVSVTGSVPDVRPYVQQAVLSVAPLNIARGTQNKILECLAMGVPTVCSTLAAKGVDVIPGEHVLTASTPAEYVDAILRLLENHEERRRFSEAGRARVLSHHNWENSMKKLDSIIDDCMAHFRARKK
jgi:hypothetical protein